ncbi:DUF423 domain-containing protein [Magnetospira sp. QH-2]|uniref:DUF423 domain-containing protein n=1 Tax=Magnetospira sp. (strain QH-2) TaxID=1288970 RepID=UPI0003E816C0|nr:DUF423 domain-containing protein [Magnetospira sp. QH-2]CCQ72048.1 conserved membrane protein of unknown function [Magnetospira sp. QH-2]
MRLWLTLAALNALIALTAGAYGWHMMQGEDGADSYLPIFQIGERYQMAHALALLGVAWMAHQWPGSRLVMAAGWGFQGGIILFCGTLYAMSLTGELPVAGAAPVGGFLLMGGWIALAAAGFVNARPRSRA